MLLRAITAESAQSLIVIPDSEINEFIADKKKWANWQSMTASDGSTPGTNEIANDVFSIASCTLPAPEKLPAVNMREKMSDPMVLVSLKAY